MKPSVPSRMAQSIGFIAGWSEERGLARSFPAVPAREQVREQAVRSRHARRELAEEADAGVDEAPLAVVAGDQAAVEGRFARIVPGDEARVLGVDLAGEVETALLHPAGEVGVAEAVRRGHQRVIGG